MKTRIIDASDKDGLDQAAQLIKAGDLVVFPTETVYGLGADAFNVEAVKKIFIAKGRPGDNPLIIHLAKSEDIYDLAADLPQKARQLMDAFWPGPLTMVLKKAPCVPDEVTSGLDTVALRVPDHPIAKAFIERAGCPIAAPSANRSGRPSPTETKHVLEDLDGRVAAIITASDAEIGLESTVIDMTCEPPVVLRPGDVTLAELRRVLGQVDLSPATMEETTIEKAISPGMKYSHYSPQGQLIVVKGSPAEIKDKIRRALRQAKKSPMKYGVLSRDETMANYQEGIIISLGSQDNPREMAKNLYSRLRTFDELGVEVIYAEDIPMDNTTLALINRLYKAAAYTFL